MNYQDTCRNEDQRTWVAQPADEVVLSFLLGSLQNYEPIKKLQTQEVKNLYWNDQGCALTIKCHLRKLSLEGKTPSELSWITSYDEKKNLVN